MSLCCSFCGSTSQEVRKLIVGPAVYICDECIPLCCDILSEHSEKIVWDPQNVDEVDQARRKFEDLADQGYKPYRLVEVPGEPMKDFDPDAGRLFLIRG